MNNYKNRGRKNSGIMPVNLGKLLAELIRKKRVTNSAIARKMNRAVSAIYPILRRPSMQCYLLWELSVVLKYNFFDILSEELKKKIGDKLESPYVSVQQSITELKKENEQLRSENGYLKKAIDALAK